MKKGFTLMELLGVIIVLTIITLLILPNIINSLKNSGKTSEELMDNFIVSAAKLYLSDNFSNFSKSTQYVYCLPVSKLVEDNYLTSPVKYKNIDDITGIKSIKITYTTKFNYDIVDAATCSSTNYLIVQSQVESDQDVFLDTPIIKSTIEKIVTVDNTNVPSRVLGVYDVSELKNGSIKLWYLDEDGNGLYEVYIGQVNGVNGNANSKKLFSYLTNLSYIDLRKFNTDDVINMSYMFQNCTNLRELYMNNIVTTNVTDTSHMFDNCINIKNIDLSSFSDEHLANTSYMFYNTVRAENVNIKNMKFANTQYNAFMFKNMKNNSNFTINCDAQRFVKRSLANSGVLGTNISIGSNGCTVINDVSTFGGTIVPKSSNDTYLGTIYLNPKDITTTCDAEVTNNITSGCMKFYVFAETSNTYYLILDHNTTNYVAWNSSGNNSNGMNEVRTTLSMDTAGWVGNPRLITADEVATIVGANSTSKLKWNSSKIYKNNANINDTISWFYLDGSGTSYSASNGWQKRTANTQNKSKYAWLYDNTNSCTSYGCNTANEKTKGYWTSTKAISEVSTTWDKAWYVSNGGALNIADIQSTSAAGIRPVIELNKSLIDGELSTVVVAISNLSSSGYTVTITGIPTSGVNRVLFPTWTDSNDQDDIVWGVGTNNGDGSWSYRVSTADHNNETGKYMTHVYIYYNDNSTTFASSSNNGIVIVPAV